MESVGTLLNRTRPPMWRQRPCLTQMMPWRIYRYMLKTDTNQPTGSGVEFRQRLLAPSIILIESFRYIATFRQSRKNPSVELRE